jgi:lactate dehydrogenase-like 2-hydroxyacid dehydrogenase
MRVLYHDAVRATPEAERELKATYVDKETLLRESDFVTLHVLLSVETRHLVDERALRSMKDGGSCQRRPRPIVDEEHSSGSQRRWIAAAGLDVFEGRRSIPDCRL